MGNLIWKRLVLFSLSAHILPPCSLMIFSAIERPRPKLAVTSNVVLSLGMVGALSIVRFRTAIKDPLDLVFLFWAIGAGIILASGMLPLAIVGSIVIGVILLVFVNRKSHTNPYIVVIHCKDSATEKAISPIIFRATERE